MAERNVRLNPGDSLRVVAASGDVPFSEQQRRARIEAITGARGFFQTHATEIEYLLGGRVEDMDRLQMDAGEQLRGVALSLMDAGVGMDEVVKDIQASLVAQAGRSDTTRLSDIARAYGGVLSGTVTRIQEERTRQS